jgi:hypothetical protein
MEGAFAWDGNAPGESANCGPLSPKERRRVPVVAGWRKAAARRIDDDPPPQNLGSLPLGAAGSPRGQDDALPIETSPEGKHH